MAACSVRLTPSASRMIGGMPESRGAPPFAQSMNLTLARYGLKFPRGLEGSGRTRRRETSRVRAPCIRVRATSRRDRNWTGCETVPRYRISGYSSKRQQ
jgi:hypothetical protein